MWFEQHAQRGPEELHNDPLALMREVSERDMRRGGS
jgi:hypothetical protein